MEVDDYRQCQEIADMLPVVLGLDLDAASQMVRLYLGKDERRQIVETIAQVLVDTARGLETPFVGQIWVATTVGDTTVAYFQVVRTTETTVRLRAIEQRVYVDKGDHGSYIPLRSRFVEGSQVVEGELTPRGALRLDDGRALEPWSGTPSFWLSYG